MSGVINLTRPTKVVPACRPETAIEIILQSEYLAPGQDHVLLHLVDYLYEIESIALPLDRPFGYGSEHMQGDAMATLVRILPHVHMLSLQDYSYRLIDRLKLGAVEFGSYFFMPESGKI